MRRWSAWLVGAACAVAAVFVVAARPSEDAWEDPFVAHAHIGEAGVGRLLQVTVDRAVLADRVADRGDDAWSASGNWLVTELTAQAVGTEVDAKIMAARLISDGLRIRASTRPDDTLLREPLRVGVDTTGMVVFELPPDLHHGTVTLQFTTADVRPAGESVVEITVDLDSLERVPAVVVVAPEVAP